VILNVFEVIYSWGNVLSVKCPFDCNHEHGN